MAPIPQNRHSQLYEFSIPPRVRKSMCYIHFVFPENSQVSFNSPNFYELNIESFQKAAEALSSQNVSVKTQGNKVITKYSATKDSSILFTLPYDKGWHASKS